MTPIDDPGAEDPRRHGRLREALGAYALGQLDDADHREVSDHVAACDSCADELTDIGPLAAMLRAVDPDAIQPVGITPPPELDARILRALPSVAPLDSSGRARRWVPLGAAALVAAAAAVFVTNLVAGDSAPQPAVIAVPRVEVARGVTASAGLVDHTWGVEIKLRASGLASGERFHLWVVGGDGRRYDGGEFVGVADTTIICDMSSSVLLDDAASFRVVDESGAPVITGDMPS